MKKLLLVLLYLPMIGFGQGYGCMDPNACNYDPAAFDNGGCDFSCIGCMDSTACNYDSTVSIADSSCLYGTLGCTDINALNYDTLAICDDGSCLYCVYGCTDILAINYNSSTTCDDGTCSFIPQGINYQAVARDATGDILMNQTLTIQLSVISDITTSAVSWQETHSVTTNDYGLFAAIIGQGTSTTVGFSATFDVVDWGASNHLLKVEIDYGSGYVDMGTTAFMSVPYALYSANSGSDGVQGLQGPPGPAGTDGTNGTNGVDGVGIAQNLSISGDTLFISNGMHVIIPGLGLVSSLIIEGCTDSTMFNYNSLANTDDGSCIAVVLGCTDSTATNYNVLANTDDGSCCIDGCTDSTVSNYDASATCDDGSCCIDGCTDATALNYDASATCDDGSCIGLILGCIDTSAVNYTAYANTDDGSCCFDNNACIGSFYLGGVVFYLDGNGGGLICDINDLGNAAWGCFGTTISGADGTAIGTGNQNTIDILNGCSQSGIPAELCNNSTAQGYSDWFLPSKDELNQIYLNRSIITSSSLNNGGAQFALNGHFSSTENNAYTAWMQYLYSGSQQAVDKTYGSRYVRAVRTLEQPSLGCTDPIAINYNPLANFDDGSCIIYGCIDSISFNYNPNANTDDGSCIAVVNGCTDSTALNYSSFANTDNGSCIYPHAIGDIYEGGIIFYLDGNGGGLIAAALDQSTAAEWGCYGTNIAGADGTVIGTGSQNTIDIEAGCTTPGTAADICANLTLNGYSDWFLPSRWELNEMYVKKSVIGGFASTWYYSSSEYSSTTADVINFGANTYSQSDKFDTRRIRAIRAF